LIIMNDYDSSEERSAAHQMLREMRSFDPTDDVEGEFPENAWATFANKHGVYQLVGNGEVVNPITCDTPYRLKSCPTPEKHGATLQGDFTGKARLTLTYTHCHNKSCPLCYKSWVYRKARADTKIIEFAAKGGYDAKGVYHAPMGKPQHIVVSFPRELYGLSPAMMFKKAFAAAKARGVIGANAIWHGLRYDVLRGWYVGHHFHMVGFLADGYSCRSCPHKHYRGTDVICDKVDCSGFERRTRDLYARDGFIVKVLGERESVYRTLFYQLTHCTIEVGKVRFQPSRWFGSLGCRKLARAKVEREPSKCLICGSEEVYVHYHGSKKIVHEQWRDGYERRVLVDVEEGGEPVIEIAEPIMWRKDWG
jgi:hypothetical protein